MKKLIFVLFACGFCVPSAFCAGPGIHGDAASGWTVETEHAAYRIEVGDDGNVRAKYFGPRTGQAHTAVLADVLEVPVVTRMRIRQLPVVEVIFPDQVREIEMVYDGAEIRQIDGRPALAIRQKDKVYPLTVVSYIRPVPGADILEKWIEVSNGGKKSVTVTNLLSGSLFLPQGDYTATTWQGDWGQEFQPETTRLTTGTKTVEVRSFKSYGFSAFMVRPATDTEYTRGPVWFGMVNYSGNWRVDFYKRFAGYLQIVGGINYWDTASELKAGATTASPRMVIGFSPDGEEGVQHRFHDYLRNEVLPERHRGELRPVIYNSWYATTFNVNEEHQYALGKIAKELGMELFMMDDGWFKGRVDDRAGLGDWTVDRNKFPNGLNGLIDKINDLGLDFGIWIEPEMVNPNSDLYRAHPDWIVHMDNRERTLRRHQMMLNLAREDVFQYLLKTYTDLLSGHNIKYVKWDRNRFLNQAGWPGESPLTQLSMRIAFIDNLYRLLAELQSRFPTVWFENCSSGGGRVDGGMLRYMDLNWTSDNTDPVARQSIQYGYLGVFPASTMLSLTTQEDWQSIGLSHEYKLDVAMQGVLGIGNDLGKMTEEEKALFKAKIAFYKEIRETVQQGTLYRLAAPFEGERTALQYVSRDGKQAVVMLYNREASMKDIPSQTRIPSGTVRLRGLDPAACYTVDGYDDTFTGAHLAEVGIPWPLNKAFTSRILKVTRL